MSLDWMQPSQTYSKQKISSSFLTNEIRNRDILLGLKEETKEDSVRANMIRAVFGWFEYVITISTTLFKVISSYF